MRVRYIGTEDPTDNASCGVFGLTFERGEWVDLDGPAPSKLLTNPTFEVDTDGDGEAGPTVEELRAMLDELGVKFHHKSGAAKLAELLEQATAPNEAEGAGA